jgi:tetratricopeptide (TPR) repeat protein
MGVHQRRSSSSTGVIPGRPARRGEILEDSVLPRHDRQTMPNILGSLVGAVRTFASAVVAVLGRGRDAEPFVARFPPSSLVAFAGLVWLLAGCQDSSSRRVTKAANQPEPVPSIDRDSILSCALATAEEVSIPAMRGEQNLTAKSNQLAFVARLLAKAGRYDEAIRLVEADGKPQRVEATAWGEVAVVAIQTAHAAVAERAIQWLSGSDEWTAGGALGRVAMAIYDSGDTRRAFGVAASIKRPEDKVDVLRKLVGRTRGRGSNAEGSRWLAEAARAAAQIRPGRKPGGMRNGALVDLLDYSRRQKALLDLIDDLSGLGSFDRAQEVFRAFDDMPENSNSIWKAKALMAIAGARRAAGQAEAAGGLMDQALGMVESYFRMTVGDRLDTVEVMTDLSRGFAALGRTGPARAVLTKALAEVSPVESVPDRDVAVQFGVEMLTEIARGYLDLDLKQVALRTLDRAATLARGLPIPPPPHLPRTPEVPGRPYDPFATPQDTAWWRRCSTQQDQVAAFSKVAALLESAGEDIRAEALCRQAIEQTSGIDCGDWRGYAWDAIVRAYLDAKLPERALALLLAAKQSGSDQDGAWAYLLDRLPSKIRLERLSSILESGAPVSRKVELLAKLGTELERTGQPEQAARRVTEALALIASQPKEKGSLLELLADESSSSGRKPNAEQAELLRRIRR